jgi:hypothetical protein
VSVRGQDNGGHTGRETDSVGRAAGSGVLVTEVRNGVVGQDEPSVEVDEVHDGDTSVFVFASWFKRPRKITDGENKERSEGGSRQTRPGQCCIPNPESQAKADESSWLSTQRLSWAVTNGCRMVCQSGLRAMVRNGLRERLVVSNHKALKNSPTQIIKKTTSHTPGLDPFTLTRA